MNPVALVVAGLLPKVAVWLGMHMMKPSTKNYFINITKGVIKQR